MAGWRQIGSRAAARARDVAHLLTTPLLPDDLLGTLNPVWSTTEPAGRVVAVRRETADTSTLLLQHRTAPAAAPAPASTSASAPGSTGCGTGAPTRSTSRPDDRLLAVTVTAIPGGTVSGALAHATPGRHRAAARAARGRVRAARAGAGEAAVRHRRERRHPGHGDAAPPGRHPPGGARRRRRRALRPDRGRRRLRGGAPRAGRGDRACAWSSGTPPLDGRLTPDALAYLVPDWAGRQAWACGPAGLLDDLGDWWDRHGDRGRAARRAVRRPAADRGGRHRRPGAVHHAARSRPTRLPASR